MPPSAWPPWVVMWVLASAIYAACKWLTWRRTLIPGTSAGRQVAYLLAWPGMDAKTFLDPLPLSADRRPTPFEWMFATAKLGLGVVLTWGAVPLISPDTPILRGWVGMVGLIFLLHFGTFHLLSCAWRAAGIDARTLMSKPGAGNEFERILGQALEHGIPRPHLPIFVPSADGIVRPPGRGRGRVPCQRPRSRSRHFRPGRGRLRLADALLRPSRNRLDGRTG